MLGRPSRLASSVLGRIRTSRRHNVLAARQLRPQIAIEEVGGMRNCRQPNALRALLPSSPPAPLRRGDGGWRNGHRKFLRHNGRGPPEANAPPRSRED